MAALVFDLDGTLVDSAPELHKAANAFLAEKGLPVQTLDAVKSFVGNGAVKLTERLLAAAGQPAEGAALDAQAKRFVEIYAALPPGDTVTYPGVPQELARLAGQGHRMGICTNKPAGPTRAILDALGLAKYFGAVVGGDSLDVQKPDRRMMIEVADRLGSKTALLVGDSEVDAATALAANVPFILFTEGYRKRPAAEIPHDAVFARWADFPDTLRRVYL
ncbi:phosphoglycolate phosphatase [Pseudaestuariivita atlantica]|uniref:Phosphoglycolate phosphatase n=1 Tax=Pseudaestuariivita atlantica TaxID=1317121 RepID=A0A0L1JKU0_9RHOB|nr:phosphoglycolate phosphatase [Pseudaestuariivita atlantica]KNG92342.1 hypothetical protein ATO11_17130 [Pseudaestuariivita atlantica]